MNKKLRIGILVDNSNTLKNWELRLIEHLKNSTSTELALVIEDGRKTLRRKTIRFKLRRKSIDWILGKVFFTLQMKIEKQLFAESSHAKSDTLHDYLKQIPRVSVDPVEKGYVDYFRKEDVEEIMPHNLDLIIRHGFGILRGSILEAAKYGVWSFHHADNNLNRGGPAGFWEVFNREDVVGATLQRLTSELDGGLIIDKAFFNRHWSALKTQTLCYEGSVSLIIKNINSLISGDTSFNESPGYDGPLYSSPNFLQSLKYIFQFYSVVLKKLNQTFQSKCLGKQYFKWSLYVGKGQFLQAPLYRAKMIVSPKNEFWADPFAIERNGTTYVFFENYEYSKGKGKISLGVLKEDHVEKIADVIDQTYHLSYPYLFEHGDNVYMIPESHESKRLEIYVAEEFPKNWRRLATAFEGEETADPTVFKDSNNDLWLFINKRATRTCPFDNELHIYKIDSLTEGSFTPHLQNPVLIDSRVARNGGSIFMSQGAYYRPSQRNIQGVYGKGLNINRIDKLTLSEYKETTIYSTYPRFRKGLESMHHLQQLKDRFIIDATTYKT